MLEDRGGLLRGGGFVVVLSSSASAWGIPAALWCWARRLIKLSEIESWRCRALQEAWGWLVCGAEGVGREVVEKKGEEMEVDAGRGDVAGTCAMEIAVAASLPDEELCLGGSCTGQDCVGPKRGVWV